MHLKNYSLIEDNQIKLAPFYDLLSTRLVISEKLDSEEFALTIGGKKKKINLAIIMKFGETIGMNEKQIENVLNNFQTNLTKATNFINKSFLSELKKKEYQELLIERAKRINIL